MFLVTWQECEGLTDPFCSLWEGPLPAFVMGDGAFTVEQVAIPGPGEPFVWDNAEDPMCEGAGWVMAGIRGCHLVVERGSDARYLSLLEGAQSCFMFGDGAWHFFDGGWAGL